MTWSFVFVSGKEWICPPLGPEVAAALCSGRSAGSTALQT